MGTEIENHKEREEPTALFVAALIRHKRASRDIDVRFDMPLEVQFPAAINSLIVHVAGSTAKILDGRALFQDCAVEGITFRMSNISFSTWIGCSFRNVSFERCALENCRFFGCSFQNCSFTRSSFKDASFSVGAKGSETRLVDCVFHGSHFGGASSENLVCVRTVFRECKLNRFSFTGALCEGLTFVGTYKYLIFPGSQADPCRNKPIIDLLNARFTWFEADYGVDLSRILTSDGLLIANRIHNVRKIADALETIAKFSSAGRTFRFIYSNENPSPLSDQQTMLLLSRNTVAELDSDLTPNEIDELFSEMKRLSS